jgi:hypothetical protein
VTGIKNEPGGCAPLFELANVLPASAGRHPSAGVLGRNVITHDERIDVRLVHLPVDPVMDDQQCVAHGLGQVGLIHISLEIVCEGLQVNHDRLALDAPRNRVLDQLFENLGAFQHELRAIHGFLGFTQVVEYDLIRDLEQHPPAVIDHSLKLGAVVPACNVFNLNHTWSLQ